MILRPSRTVGLAALVVAGALFLLYPALRPYTDETTLAGARAMASGAWVAAHSAAMIAFLLLPAGILALGAWSPRAVTAAVLAWAGVGLVLPYYGAETFGLQALGARAVADRDATLLDVAEAFRLGAVPMTFFAVGLLLLAAAGIVLARATWPTPARLGGLLIGVGLALFLPQFFAPPALRIVHGAILAAGCVLLAVALARQGRVPDADREPAPTAA